MQWMMLQQDKPDDFVIATGIQHSVRDFVDIAAKEIGIEIIWKGTGIDEKGYFNNKCIVQVDSRYFRPAEVETLLGDATKAKKILGWSPEITFQELVSEMIAEDLRTAEKNLNLANNGFKTLSHHE
jgi:GDPmannose 4,6-dehydratase